MISVDAVIFWLFVAGWAVVLGLIFLVQAPRIVGEVKRIMSHVAGLVGESGLSLEIAKGEAAVARIEAAIGQLPAVQARAVAAAAAMRATPLIPPNVREFIANIRLEIAAFKREFR